MTSPKALLDQLEILPKKSLGQNFIHDPHILEKIVTIAELSPDDKVLEIGPGTGALTEKLANAVPQGQVIAVEIDERLEPILTAKFAAQPNVKLIFADFLAHRLGQIAPTGDYVVVANLPYYITSAILRHLLESERRPRKLILTVQLEVAERLIAKPGDMSLLTVSVQFYARAKIAARINRAVFYPRPDVDSAVVRLDVYDQPPVEVPSEELFFRVVRAGFSQKRKQLKNGIAGGLDLDADFAAKLIDSAGIDPRRRAETLTLDEWAALSRAYAAR
jgi:16S rRNA (adenine1518-N6/adenine1519-N6)-dimethyltransferase